MHNVERLNTNQTLSLSARAVRIRRAAPPPYVRHTNLRSIGSGRGAVHSPVHRSRSLLRREFVFTGIWYMVVSIAAKYASSRTTDLCVHTTVSNHPENL